MSRPVPQSEPSPRKQSWLNSHLWQIQPVRDVMLLAAVFGLLWLGYRLSIVTVPLLLALLLAYLFEPLVARATRKGRVSRQGAAAGILILGLVTVVVPVTLGGSFAVVQGARFAQSVARDVSLLQQSIDNPNNVELRTQLRERGNPWLRVRDYVVEQQRRVEVQRARSQSDPAADVKEGADPKDAPEPKPEPKPQTDSPLIQIPKESLGALPESASQIGWTRPNETEYADAKWPQIPAGKDAEPRPISLPDSDWSPRRPDTDGRVVLLYFFHPSIKDMQANKEALVDVARRDFPRDVVAIGVMTTFPQELGFEISDAQSTADYLRAQLSTQMDRLDKDDSRYFVIDPNRRVFDAISDTPTSPLPPLIAVVSTDGLVRWWGKVGTPGFHASLAQIVRVDPGVKARHKAESTWRKAHAAATEPPATEPAATNPAGPGPLGATPPSSAGTDSSSPMSPAAPDLPDAADIPANPLAEAAENKEESDPITIRERFADAVEALAPEDTYLAIQWAINVLRANAESIGAQLLQAGGGAFGAAINTFGAVARILFTIFLTGFFFYFMCVSWPRVVSLGRDMIPDRNRERTVTLIGKMDRVIASFIRGRLTIGAIFVVYYILGYWFIGIPAPFILGALVGMLTIVPYAASVCLIGSVLLMALAPYDDFRGEWWWIVGAPIVHYWLGQLADDYFLTPAIQGKQTNMDMPTILFASIAGGALAGVYGLLLAIPVAACIKILLIEVFWPHFKRWKQGRAADPLPLPKE